MTAPLAAILLLWAAWLASWLIARRWSRRTLVRLRWRSEALYTLLVDAGFALMAASVFRRLGPRLWRLPPAADWALVVAGGAGFAICWWARIHLGRSWSWGVTLKEAHAIVQSGPYRFVRHPIYSGLILAGAATAVLEAKVLAAAGYAAMTAGLLIKARLEERFLRSQLGASFDLYAARTGMVFPRLSRSTREA